MTNNQQAARELLPCPFCGESPKLHTWSDHGYVRIECESCGFEWDYFHNVDDAADAWNRRTVTWEWEWLPIESAPKDGSYVLLYTSVGPHTGYFSANRWWVTAGCEIHKSHRVTHWQPLPGPPRPTQERSDEQG